jgi:SAM-dependent methyltransferase
MQAEPEFRSDIQAVGQFHVRNASGQMVPLSTLVQRVSTSAPTVMQRYNLFRTADVGGNPAPGYSSGQAMRALEEMRRVLKPAGHLLFAEHGLAPEESVCKWQNRLTPAWKCISGGCHLNRPIRQMIESGGFSIDQIDTGYAPGPKPMSFLYEGSARPTR